MRLPRRRRRARSSTTAIEHGGDSRAVVRLRPATRLEVACRSRAACPPV
ncbi:hypothetical protein HMPREF0972_00871 [Actinomyces sp. oral taxon 848 str. F0332]|nr:hypothetical protein HMPREF0972_00871 [Actinomyces sp. oral taxon 848 str. F0332]